MERCVFGRLFIGWNCYVGGTMDIQSEFDFIKAAEKDIAMLTATRIQVLRAANGLELSVDMSAVEKESRDYYEKASGTAAMRPIWFLTLSCLSGPEVSVFIG